MRLDEPQRGRRDLPGCACRAREELDGAEISTAPGREHRPSSDLDQCQLAVRRADRGDSDGGSTDIQMVGLYYFRQRIVVIRASLAGTMALHWRVLARWTRRLCAGHRALQPQRRLRDSVLGLPHSLPAAPFGIIISIARLITYTIPRFTPSRTAESSIVFPGRRCCSAVGKIIEWQLEAARRRDLAATRPRVLVARADLVLWELATYANGAPVPRTTSRGQDAAANRCDASTSSHGLVAPRALRGSCSLLGSGS